MLAWLRMIVMHLLTPCCSSQFMEGRADLALMGYLKASELGYQRAQANAAWILSQNKGIPPGQSATSYVQPGDSYLIRPLSKPDALTSLTTMSDAFSFSCCAFAQCHQSRQVMLLESNKAHGCCWLQGVCQAAPVRSILQVQDSLTKVRHRKLLLYSTIEASSACCQTQSSALQAPLL